MSEDHPEDRASNESPVGDTGSTPVPPPPPADSAWSTPSGGPDAPLTSGDITPTAPPAGQGGKRGVVLGAGALVLALVAGAGVYAATKVGGGGTQPEDVIPATAFAFAKIDLDPAADQKVALREFAGKFPATPKPSGDDDIIDALLRKAFKESEDTECKLDYDADVKPWLGERLAIAGITGPDGKPEALGAVQLKDEAKFRAFIKKAEAPPCSDAGDTPTGYAVKDGYAVIARTQAVVDAAVKAAGEKALKDAPNFGEDLAKLDGNQIMVAWVDVRRSFELATKASPQLGMIPNAFTQQAKGRVVFGVHMEADYAEMYGRTIGGEIQGDFSGISNLSALPGNTVAAFAVNGLQDQVTKTLDQVGESGLPVDDFVAEFEGQTGLNVRNDLIAILGNKTAISLGSVPTGRDLKLGLTSTVKDPNAARSVGEKVAELGTQFGLPVESDVEGNTFYLATNDYLSDLKRDKSLGASGTFKRAMGDLGDTVAGGIYVDLGQLLKLAENEESYDDLQHLSAVGMSAGKTGSDGYFRLRVVVK